MRFEVSVGVDFSPCWKDGRACLVAGSGQTLMLTPLSGEMLLYLQGHPGAEVSAVEDHLRANGALGPERQDDLDSTVENAFMEFERIGLVRRVSA